MMIEYQNCNIFRSSPGSDSRTYARTHTRKASLSLKRRSHRAYKIIASICTML